MCNSAGGIFEMYGGTISGNTATDRFVSSGGAEPSGGVYNISGTFELHGGKITGNKPVDISEWG